MGKKEIEKFSLRGFIFFLKGDIFEPRLNCKQKVATGNPVATFLVYFSLG